MDEVREPDMAVDRCRACGGLWLDENEWKPVVGSVRDLDRPQGLAMGFQRLACPACGPELTMIAPEGNPCAGSAIATTRQRLADGAIVAIRAIGGFQLTANAHAPKAYPRAIKAMPVTLSHAGNVDDHPKR